MLPCQGSEREVHLPISFSEVYPEVGQTKPQVKHYIYIDTSHIPISFRIDPTYETYPPNPEGGPKNAVQVGLRRISIHDDLHVRLAHLR